MVQMVCICQIITNNKMILTKPILLLFFLLGLDNNQCQFDSVDNEQCKTDVSQIMDAVINNHDTANFLDHYDRFNVNIFIRYRSFPICDRSIVYMKESKIKFQSTYIKTLYNKLLSDDENKLIYKNDMSQHYATVVIDSLKIIGKNAVVKMRIPLEGVHGKFILNKQNKWNIIESDVFER